MPPASPRMTADDYWGLPADARAELIDGELWDLAAPSRLHRGMDYGTKQGLYREVDVGGYWIVDPSMRWTMVTRFAEDPAPMMYPFDEPIPVGIYPGLAINLDEVVKSA